ncbi:multicopper oxidase family protein [Desulfovibrio psychrotolerans]|uniref:multicopper oxidase family protein n=1 Tax=Desulfovibrio psychrotolerans TaxID=415242 RepID=UPI00157B22B7|nr:multicopper oxidase domain-containing protein [Desulfovibrio psychrotolerans]
MATLPPHPAGVPCSAAVSHTHSAATSPLTCNHADAEPTKRASEHSVAPEDISRRTFLRMAAAGSLLLLPPVRLLAQTGHAAHTSHPAQTVRSSLHAPVNNIPKVLTVKEAGIRAQGLPPLVYEAQTEHGVVHNPTFVVRRGERFALRMENTLKEPTIIHWHGVECDWRQAGHPRYEAGPGQTYNYDFPVTNRAATLWYHPHPHGVTGKQAHQGLVGFFIVRDAQEESFAERLGVRLGVSDLPVAIHDRRLDPSGQPIYAPTPEDFQMGWLGNAVFCNNERHARISVPAGYVRLRLLNACNARLLKLGVMAHDAPLPFTVIAADGGFLTAPVSAKAVFMAPGERTEILLDLRRFAPETAVSIVNLPFDPMHNEHEGHGAAGHDGHNGHDGQAGQKTSAAHSDHQQAIPHAADNRLNSSHPSPHAAHSEQENHGAHEGHREQEETAAHIQHGASAPPVSHGAHALPQDILPEGSPFVIATLQTTLPDTKPSQSPLSDVPPALPDSYSPSFKAAIALSEHPATKDEIPVQRFRLALSGSGHEAKWTINGLTFDMHATPIRVPARSAEIWELENEQRSMPHPMHLHGYFFQVLARVNSPQQVQELAQDAKGRVATDLGPKDTVLVWPGETVRILVDFSHPYPEEAQLFMFHCHNLEHEDAGMMLNVLVE